MHDTTVQGTPRTYHHGVAARVADVVFRVMTRAGVGAGYRHVLTVRGRVSGKARSTPVDVMEEPGHRWLVAPYGVTNWVRNARAAGEVTLSRGGRSETVRVAEQGSAESVPVLRKYLREVPITRRYFDATPESPDEVFESEAARHPVFTVSRLGGPLGAG